MAEKIDIRTVKNVVSLAEEYNRLVDKLESLKDYYKAQELSRHISTYVPAKKREFW